jgi:hypothetical protein
VINSRDTYTDFNPSRKESIEVPYGIDTINELLDKSIKSEESNKNKTREI